MMDEPEADNKERPAMDIGEQTRTWRLFVRLLHWSATAVVLLLLGLLAFCARG